MNMSKNLFDFKFDTNPEALLTELKHTSESNNIYCKDFFLFFF